MTYIKTKLLPAATHRSPVNFTATFSATTMITLAGNPTITDNSQLAYVKVVDSGGTNTQVFIPGDGCTLTFTSPTLTIVGAGTPFATGDVYEVGINVETKGVDGGLDILKTVEQSPSWAHRTTDLSYTATLSATAKSYYVIPMDTYANGSIDFKLVTGTGTTAVVKVYRTSLSSENISTITIANWWDVTTKVMDGDASFPCVASATNVASWDMCCPTITEYLMVEVDYTQGSTSTLTMYVKLSA